MQTLTGCYCLAEKLFDLQWDGYWVMGISMYTRMLAIGLSVQADH